jgi:signal transduction histidine kinase
VGVVDTVIFRAFRIRTWRETAYLLLGGAMAVVGFVLLIAGLSAGISLLITLIGIPILVLTAVAARGLAWVERWRARIVLGRRIEARYLPPPEKPDPGVEGRHWSRDNLGFDLRHVWRRVHVFLHDAQVWKDIAWLLTLSVVGFLFALAALVLWLTTVWAVTYPLWWWSAPDSWLPEVGDENALNSWAEVLVVLVGGLVLIVATPWVVAALSKVEVSLAQTFLGPGARERVGQLERSRAAAVRTQEEDRRRLERDLHDGVQARLVALALDLGMARDKLAAGDGASAGALLDEAHEEAKSTLAELRELVRGVHPAILADRGLDAAVSALAARSPVPVAVDVEVNRLPAALESAAYFVVAETLANVAKHSRATRADVRIRRLDARIVVEIADDGRGGARVGAGTGLVGLEDRVRALDGTLRVASPEGGPTVVVAELPCAS